MCYSAEAYAAYKLYVEEFGADIDIHEFAKLYGYRRRERKVKIPKGIDFMLARAEGADEIRQLVAEFNADRISSSEQEMFAQAKRLADAERKLATKETKAALNDQRVASSKIKQFKRWIGDAKRATHEPEKDDRFWPGWYAPVIIVENGRRVVKPMRYQCRPAGKPAFYDVKYPGTYNARRDNLEGFWKSQFGRTHGLMLASRFYENVDDGEGGSKVLCFEPRTGEIMLVACLWSHWTDPAGKEPDLLSFAAITDEPEPEVAAAGHDRTIINIQPQHVEAWLNPDASELQRMYDIFDSRRHPYYEHRIAA
jgi:putative SOS response-associated peptidase YedK